VRGTLEHVFHLPNVLKNIFNMLKVAGRVIHISPANNYLEHKIYCFSPCFFLGYYHANQFDIIRALLTRSHVNTVARKAEFAECGFGSNVTKLLGRVGALDNRVYNIFFVAEKTIQSQYKVIQQQTRYNKVWEDASQCQRISSKDTNLLKKIYHLIARLPGVGKKISSLAYRFYAWQSISWKQLP
jgi:hypothetical protein